MTFVATVLVWLGVVAIDIADTSLTGHAAAAAGGLSIGVGMWITYDLGRRRVNVR